MYRGVVIAALIFCCCSNPKLEKENLNYWEDSDDSVVIYDAEITKWIDTQLSNYYLYNDEYNGMERNTDLVYDSFLSSMLLGMQSNILDKKMYTIGGKSYTQLYSYVARSASATSKSSQISSSYGFVSLEYFTLMSADGTSKSWLNVQGVYGGSYAEEIGVKRGDTITAIDNILIGAYSTAEVSSLLMSPESGAALTLIMQNDGEESHEVMLTARSTNMNPILKSEIFEYSQSSKKIGYLSYCSFDTAFDSELKSEISKFRDAGITDMILDLRINGGGYVSSAQLLTSMLGGSNINFDSDKFSFYRYNDDMTLDYIYTEAITGQSYDSNKNLFYNTFDTTLDDINKLNLANKTIYCIVTNSTASASEMVINSLKGIGFNVVLIGDNDSYNNSTNGKNVGMIVFSRVSGKYQYEFAPIVFEIFNGEGEGEYQNGFSFDHNVSEYNNNYYLSDYGADEPLTAKAIELITGAPSTKSSSQIDTKSNIVQEQITHNPYQMRGAIIVAY